MHGHSCFMDPLFSPFRALGYITDNVPFAVQRRGRESFVTVSVGSTWQVSALATPIHTSDTDGHQTPHAMYGQAGLITPGGVDKEHLCNV